MAKESPNESVEETNPDTQEDNISSETTEDEETKVDRTEDIEMNQEHLLAAMLTCGSSRITMGMNEVLRSLLRNRKCCGCGLV